MQIRKALESERVVAVATAALVTAIVIGARSQGLLEPVELAVYDTLLTFRPAPPDAGERVVVVAYTERDIMSQRTYPLPDETLAQVLETVLSFGPRAVGVDFFRDVLIPPGSERLEALLQRDPRVAMIYLMDDGDKPGIPPPTVLADQLSGTLPWERQLGLADLQLDGDDTVRRALLYLQDDDGTQHLGLAFQVALRWLAAEGKGLGPDPGDPEQVALGPTPLRRFRGDEGAYVDADAGSYQMLLDFEGGEPFRAIPMDAVLRGDVSPEDFRDKMVFVGATAESVADLRHVPFGVWPGIFVHAHIASRLVHYGLGESEPLATLGRVPELLYIALCAALGAALGLRRGPAWSFVASLVLGVLLVTAAGLVGLDFEGLWIPVVPPATAGVLSAVAITAWVSRRESADRKVLMGLFARHVSTRLAEDLWEKRDQFMAGGRPTPRRQPVTVLFVDVKSFTPVAEGLDPLGLMAWVNELMEVLAAEVERHGGFVDDYFGDGMKAAFGVPLPHESEDEQRADARAAVLSAMAMERGLAQLNASWEERGMPCGRLRVGIDSGFGVAGSVGSSDRLKYTVLGDIANTAARIEGLDDSGHDFERKPVRVLVSFRTRDLLGDEFALVDRGEHKLKGKARPVRTYEVMGLREEGACEPPA